MRIRGVRVPLAEESSATSFVSLSAGLGSPEIVKLRVNRGEPFHVTLVLQLPGLAAGGLPVMSIGQKKHQPPGEATGSQLPDLYTTPPGEYHLAEAISPAFAPVTLNHNHIVWSVMRKLEAGVGTEHLVVSTALVSMR